MDDDLLVGILTKPGAPPLAMVVDKRVHLEPDALGPRKVSIDFGDDVAGVTVLEKGETKEVQGNSVTLTLPAGGGQLLRLMVSGGSRSAG